MTTSGSPLISVSIHFLHLYFLFVWLELRCIVVHSIDKSVILLLLNSSEIQHLVSTSCFTKVEHHREERSWDERYSSEKIFQRDSALKSHRTWTLEFQTTRAPRHWAQLLHKQKEYIRLPAAVNQIQTHAPVIVRIEEINNSWLDSNGRNQD